MSHASDGVELIFDDRNKSEFLSSKTIIQLLIK